MMSFTKDGKEIYYLLLHILTYILGSGKGLAVRNN